MRKKGRAKPKPRKRPECVQYFPAGPIPVRFGVCLSEKAYLAEMGRLNVQRPNPFISPGCDGEVHSFTNDKACPSLTIIMALDLAEILKSDAANATCIAAHEAVHCAQAALDHMEEKSPGEEVRAYLTDWFAYCAIKAIQAAKKGRKNTR